MFATKEGTYLEIKRRGGQTGQGRERETRVVLGAHKEVVQHRARPLDVVGVRGRVERLGVHDYRHRKAPRGAPHQQGAPVVGHHRPPPHAMVRAQGVDRLGHEPCAPPVDAVREDVAGRRLLALGRGSGQPHGQHHLQRHPPQQDAEARPGRLRQQLSPVVRVHLVPRREDAVVVLECHPKVEHEQRRGRHHERGEDRIGPRTARGASPGGVRHGEIWERQREKYGLPPSVFVVSRLYSNGQMAQRIE